MTTEEVINTIQTWINEADDDFDREEQGRVAGLRMALHEIKKIEQQSKTGRWLADVDRWGDVVTTVNGYRCSECYTFDTDKDNYCPNCGAKMEVEE